MPPIRLPRVAAVAFAVAAIACGDPTRQQATTPNLLSSFAVYPLTGSPAAVPTALSLFAGPRRADAGFTFDVAFDLDASGRILVYPVHALVGPLAGGVATRIGLQTVTGTFDALREAPERGYDTLAVRTVTPGTVVAVEIVDRASGQCLYSLSGQSLYAKFVVDSVDATRRLFVRTVVDYNCGYRSLQPDSIPKF
jgi:hypothetical protein